MCNFGSVKPNKTIVAAAMLLFAVSCGSPHHTRPERAIRAQFRTIQPLLLKSEKVDSCLAVLQAMDTAALKRPADRARWSLLYAMALDKNDIDARELSIICPAMDVFLRWFHFSRSDKFYTLYYKARIEENAGVFNSSLGSFLEAERYMGPVSDVYKARLFFGLERIYISTMSFTDAEESANRALMYAKQSADKYNIAAALIDCSILSSSRARMDEAERYLKEYESSIGVDYVSKTRDYYRAKMYYYSSFDARNTDSSLYYLNKYVNSCERIEYPIFCVVTCIKNGWLNEAENFLQMCDASHQDSYNHKYTYYYCRSIIRESKGDYKGALEDLHLTGEYVDKNYQFNLDNEIPYASDKLKNRLERLHVLFMGSTILLIVVLVLSFILYLLRKRKYELNVVRQSYLEIKDEYESFKHRSMANQQRKGHDDIKVLQRRIVLIGNSITGQNDLTYMEALEAISKRFEINEFIGVINMLGSIHCGSYYSFLKERGLDAFEVAYCILGIQLTTKELAYLFKRKNLYNVNSFLKEKLGMIEKGRIQAKLSELYYCSGSCEMV